MCNREHGLYRSDNQQRDENGVRTQQAILEPLTMGRPALAALPVHVSPVPDLDDVHQPVLVLDRIDNAVMALPHAVLISLA